MAAEDHVQTLTPGGRAVLDAASRLFYERGIAAVGVDAVAAEAGVTKKTIYDRFRSKSALVRMYLAERDERYRRWIDAWIAEHPEADPALAVFDALESWRGSQGAKGCAFVHAHAELLAEPDHPAHEVIRAQKLWLHERFRVLVEEAGHARAKELATELLALHEGATVLYSLTETGDAVAAARRAAQALLRTG
ncbi:TetR/AcrR family transcriptional regulator [Sediminivirga luteola]|uniref:TetR/AcrR family transcriptional regulator n=1 Tax=Sediminivirga luteola TaxID=1774748 RepID=UPI001F590191|nr:TetR/AcrR family transcriptional regulator [Sediminivirga luteola]MCI2266606.1 TetR/AcrR family transcriptional regulator [Sediminivirga luteola]